MYTNGYTGTPYLTIVAIKRCDGSSVACLTDAEFANMSEHITLVDSYVFTASPFDDCTPDGATFTGWDSAQS